MFIQPTVQIGPDAAIATAIAQAQQRAPYCYFDQLIIERGGVILIGEEDDCSLFRIVAGDTILHRIAAGLSDEQSMSEAEDDECDAALMQMRQAHAELYADPEIEAALWDAREWALAESPD